MLGMASDHVFFKGRHKAHHPSNPNTQRHRPRSLWVEWMSHHPAILVIDATALAGLIVSVGNHLPAMSTTLLYLAAIYYVLSIILAARKIWKDKE